MIWKAPNTEIHYKTGDKILYVASEYALKNFVSFELYRTFRKFIWALSQKN